jgi:hypothetical protein
LNVKLVDASRNQKVNGKVRAIIVSIIIITAIEFSLGDSSPYTGTDKTNKYSVGRATSC